MGSDPRESLKYCLNVNQIQRQPDKSCFPVTVESFVASIVSALLSVTGVSATSEGCIIYLPSLNHRFVVTLSCMDLAGISLVTFMYTFLTWAYITLNGRSLRRRTYLILGLMGFIAFFFVNVLRMFTEIYLLAKVYGPVYTYYLLNWQSFEEQIGIGMMFATLLVLSFSSWAFLKRRINKQMFY